MNVSPRLENNKGLATLPYQLDLRRPCGFRFATRVNLANLFTADTSCALRCC